MHHGHALTLLCISCWVHACTACVLEAVRWDHMYRGAKHGAGGEPIREDVACVVPAWIQPKRPQADYVYLLAAAPFYSSCRSVSSVMHLSQTMQTW